MKQFFSQKNTVCMIAIHHILILNLFNNFKYLLQPSNFHFQRVVRTYTTLALKCCKKNTNTSTIQIYTFLNKCAKQYTGIVIDVGTESEVDNPISNSNISLRCSRLPKCPWGKKHESVFPARYELNSRIYWTLQQPKRRKTLNSKQWSRQRETLPLSFLRKRSNSVIKEKKPKQ